MSKQTNPESVVREIRRKTRRKYSTEEKIRIVLHIIDHNLRHSTPIPCCLFSLEMNDEGLYRRWLAKRANVDSKKILTSDLSKADFAGIKDVLGEISASPLLLQVDDDSSLTIEDIQGRARRWKYKNNIPDGRGIIAVDFVQLVKMEQKRNETRAEKIRHVAYELARLAKDLKVATIGVAQLNREAEGKRSIDNEIQTPVPRVSHIEGSGSICQASHAVLLVDPVWKRESDPFTDEVKRIDVIIGAQRNGVDRISCHCRANLQTSTFMDAYEEADLEVILSGKTVQ